MRHKLTATIYDKRGRILSVGENSYVKTHPLQALYAAKARQSSKQYLHAEIAAIARLRARQAPYRIFVARFGASGTPRCARPCAICEIAIKEAGIERIEYTV